MTEQRLRGVAQGAVTVAAALGLAGCAPHPAVPVLITPAPQWTTSAPQVVQQRGYACGSGVAPPLAPSSAGDPVRLEVSGTEFAGDRITAAYRISSADPTEVLTYPVSPTPPTLLLMDAGHIVGRQKSVTSSTVDGRAAELRPIGRRPYVSSLTIDELCPGTDWARVRAHPGRYRVEVVMSRQPTSGPQTGPPRAFLADPLTTASARLTR